MNNMKQLTTEELYGLKTDVFSKFCKQYAILSAGSMEDFNCMTLSWGMLGTIWTHATGAVTVYVSPNRYTWQYVEQNDLFTVSFFPQEYAQDVRYLGTHSGRDEDKVAHTRLTPIPMGGSVGFAQAQLTLVCRKAYTHQFELDRVPDFMRDGLYTKVAPHYEIIGFIEEASQQSE